MHGKSGSQEKRHHQVVLSTSFNSYEIVNGLFSYIDTTGAEWDVRILRNNDQTQRSSDILSSLEWRPNGIIMTNRFDERTMQDLAKDTIPLVVIGLRNETLESRTEHISFVRNDNDGIGRLAASHLASLGKFRSFAYLPETNEEEMYWSVERFAAFQRETARCGCSVLSPSPDEDIADFIAKLPRPAAIFAGCDRIAANAIMQCRRRGVDVVDNIAILGVDNDETTCRHMTPKLSSIHPDYFKMGQTAAKELSRLMSSPQDSIPSILTIRPRGVVDRDSTHHVIPAATLVKEMESYIHANACRGAKPTDVVAHMRVSRRLAELRFRQLTGHTLRAAIESRRMEVALEMLSNGATVTATAHACGFSSPNRLTRVFSQRKGMSIRKWRS